MNTLPQYMPILMIILILLGQFWPKFGLHNLHFEAEHLETWTMNCPHFLSISFFLTRDLFFTQVWDNFWLCKNI